MLVGRNWSARNSLRESSVQYLFNSRGQHIANFVSGQLHAPTGQNVGHYLGSQSIFIDMQGRYLGEIVSENRLMYRRNSPHPSVNYGSYGNMGMSAITEIRVIMDRLVRQVVSRMYLVRGLVLKVS
jgi:hypothetical protein